MNLDEDDFPINSASSSKLANLFSDNVTENVSFHYNPQKQTLPSKITKPPSLPLSVLTGRTVDAFQLKKSGYVSEGKLGLVILGNDEACHYRLYMYRNDENKVASTEITPTFCFKVQENNYVSFQDSNGITWSLHFDKDTSLTSFCREIALSRWKASPNKQISLVQELYKGDPNFMVGRKDKVDVKFSIFLLNNGKVGEKIAEKSKEAVSTSSIWPENVVGKCLDSKTIIITQSHQLLDFEHSLQPKQMILIEMDIKKISVHVEESKPEATQHQQKSTVELEKEENTSMANRLSKIGVQLPSLSQPETELSEPVPQQVKPAAKPTPTSREELRSSTPSELSFDISMNSQFTVFLSEVRTSNSEIRMNINRVTDKVDSLIHKVESCEDMNAKWKPFVEKVSSLEDCISSLIEQNQSALALIKQVEPPEINSEIQSLIKRNKSLEESLLNSNVAIKNLEAKLQNEISIRLSNENKLTWDQNSCKGSQANKRIGQLEHRVKELESLNKEIESQNLILSQHATALLNEKLEKEKSYATSIKEKDAYIAELTRSLELMSSQIRHYEEKELLERDLNIGIKRVLNRADKALKLQFKEIPEINKQISLDDLISQTLREVANEFQHRLSHSNNSSVRGQSSIGSNISYYSNRSSGSGDHPTTYKSNPGISSSFSPNSPLPKPRQPTIKTPDSTISKEKTSSVKLTKCNLEPKNKESSTDNSLVLKTENKENSLNIVGDKTTDVETETFKALTAKGPLQSQTPSYVSPNNNSSSNILSSNTADSSVLNTKQVPTNIVDNNNIDSNYVVPLIPNEPPPLLTNEDDNHATYELSYSDKEQYERIEEQRRNSMWRKTPPPLYFDSEEEVGEDSSNVDYSEEDDTRSNLDMEKDNAINN